MKPRLKYGVLGAGHLGKIHIKCIQESVEVDLTGFFDPDPQIATEVAAQFGIVAFSTYDALLAACDIVDIVTPTVHHFQSAIKALEAGKHVFIEKPVTETIAQAEQLLEMQYAKGLKIQVGHVERFNPAFLALGGRKLDPMFIEAHRLATFNPRGTDVSVVLDLMIHDLDILLTIVSSPVAQIAANGVSVVSDSPDICNARITFENGCVANLTASRISLKQMRKMRLFQRDAYISLDFLERQASILRLNHQQPAEEGASFELDTPKGKKWIAMESPAIGSVNAIKMELELFAESILNQTSPVVTLEDGLEALRVAHQILNQIEHVRIQE